MQVVQVGDLDRDRVAVGRPGLAPDGLLPRQVRADDRVLAGAEVGRGALRDDGAAVGAGPGAELDHPVGGVDDLDLVLDHHHRVAVGGEHLDGGAESLDVARVQADRRLVEHVEHAGGVGADGRGQLEALPFAGRQRAAGPVELQVAEAQLEQRVEHLQALLDQSVRHPGEFLRGQLGHFLDEAPQLGQVKRADLGQVAAVEGAAERLRVQPTAVADGAGADFEEFFHLLAAGRVVAASGVLDRGHRVLVVDVQRDRPRRPLAQRDVALHRLPVEHDVPLPRRQLAERHVQTHAQLPGGVTVEPPATRVPWQHGPVVNALVLVRHQGVLVHLDQLSGPVAGRAGAVGVERERLGARVGEPHPADRAGHLHALGRDGRRNRVTVRTDMRAQPRHDQPEHVEHLAHRPDGAAHPGDGRPLAQGEGGGQVINAVHVRPLRLAQPPPAVGGQAFEETLHALGEERPHGERALARAGHPGDGHHAPQRDVDIKIPQVVMADAARLDGKRQPGHTVGRRAGGGRTGHAGNAMRGTWPDPGRQARLELMTGGGRSPGESTCCHLGRRSQRSSRSRGAAGQGQVPSRLASLRPAPYAECR